MSVAAPRPRAVFSTLWPKNHGVLARLIERGYSVVAWDGMVTPLVQSVAANAGGRVRLISEFIGPARAAAAGRASAEMNAHLRKTLAARPLALAGWEAQCDSRKLADIVAHCASTEGHQLFGLIAGLEALRETHDVEAVVVNESDLPFSRIALRWAAKFTIPSFLLTHGSNLGADYTVTGDTIADYILVFGERSVAHFVESGIARDRIHVTGNPAWDEYPALLAQRSAVRKHVIAECGLDPQLPIVIFGTTFSLQLTTAQETDVFADTTRAFCRAVRILRDRGIALNCLIKDRPSNAEFGKSRVEQIALEERIGAYQYAAGRSDYGLIAADVLVAYESNLFIEAMFAELPSINLWTPNAWLMGPNYAAGEGLEHAYREEPEGLADTIARMLLDADFRRACSAAMRASARSFHHPLDGRAAERCAEVIAAGSRA